jgi:hypothetical protein
MSAEWGVRHVFDNPPSPVVMRSDTKQRAQERQQQCAENGNACTVVHRDSPDAEWVTE